MTCIRTDDAEALLALSVVDGYAAHGHTLDLENVPHERRRFVRALLAIRAIVRRGHPFVRIPG